MSLSINKLLQDYKDWNQTKNRLVNDVTVITVIWNLGEQKYFITKFLLNKSVILVLDINENTVNREYLEEGSIFVRNRDKDGKSLLILKCKKHVKGQKDFEELKKVVIYWFERAER